MELLNHKQFIELYKQLYPNSIGFVTDEYTVICNDYKNYLQCNGIDFAGVEGQIEYKKHRHNSYIEKLGKVQPELLDIDVEDIREEYSNIINIDNLKKIQHFLVHYNLKDNGEVDKAIKHLDNAMAEFYEKGQNDELNMDKEDITNEIKSLNETILKLKEEIKILEEEKEQGKEKIYIPMTELQWISFSNILQTKNDLMEYRNNKLSEEFEELKNIHTESMNEITRRLTKINKHIKLKDEQ